VNYEVDKLARAKAAVLLTVVKILRFVVRDWGPQHARLLLSGISTRGIWLLGVGSYLEMTKTAALGVGYHFAQPHVETTCVCHQDLFRICSFDFFILYLISSFVVTIIYDPLNIRHGLFDSISKVWFHFLVIKIGFICIVSEE
jgi:hypothetical protein